MSVTTDPNTMGEDFTTAFNADDTAFCEVVDGYDGVGEAYAEAGEYVCYITFVYEGRTGVFCRVSGATIIDGDDTEAEVDARELPFEVATVCEEWC